jgi:RES domain-containing protein
VRNAVDPIAVVGEWTRHAPHRAAPLGHGALPTSGRWQRGSTIRGLYLADDPATAIAEWYRWLAERGLPPGDGIPHDHHRWKVSIEVANLSTPERLSRVGLGMPEPSRSTWPAFQEVGERLWRDGWAGVLAPCAARPSAQVLCVFANAWPPAGCRPVRIEKIAEVPGPPTGMTT